MTQEKMASAFSSFNLFWNSFFGQDFDLGKALHSDTFTKERLAENVIGYKLDLPESLPAKPKYFLVINTLMGNALKYAHDGQLNKSLTVEGREDGQNYIISVSDNGFGIEPEQRLFVFDKNQSGGHGNGHGMGQGLGLYLTKKWPKETAAGWK